MQESLHYYRHHFLCHGWWWLLHANYFLASNLSCNITSWLLFTSSAWMGTALRTESWSWDYCFLLETLSSSLFCFFFICWHPDWCAVDDVFVPTLASHLLRSVHFSGHVAGRPRCTLDVLMLYPQIINSNNCLNILVQNEMWLSLLILRLTWLLLTSTGPPSSWPLKASTCSSRCACTCTRRHPGGIPIRCPNHGGFLI